MRALLLAGLGERLPSRWLFTSEVLYPGLLVGRLADLEICLIELLLLVGRGPWFQGRTYDLAGGKYGLLLDLE
eukprot:1014788-Amorphochlora_amoeboformis.AAC.2